MGPIAPAAATVCTIGLYLLPVPNREPGHVPVAVGFLAGSVAALGAAWAARSIATGPDSNGIAFSELQARTDTIRCRISAVLHAEARLQVASVDRDRCISIIRGDLAWLDAALNPTATDFAWLVGLKFIQAKRVVHDAEEQLLLLASMTELRGVIREETVRIADANTDKRAEWTSWLNQANDLLRAPERESQAEGRELLRRVRRARNHLREEADYQTVQLRNRVVLTITVAGVGLWFLLAMAIIRGASPTTIHGAASLFLVAGVVGLLRGLIQERRRPAEADYGLAVSRVWRTVFISGTAGVFAVPIVALITGQSAIGIELLFDIGAHPSGLLIAAAAGLVPARIVDLIAEFADSFSNWIHSRSDPPKPPKDDDLS